ncbi:MAG: hypothetical protein ACM3WV_04525 [Bacillota bacterium]
MELVLVLIAFGVVFIIYAISRIERQKQLEEEQLKTELEQSYRMIENLSTERREFRNKLQVMTMLAGMGKPEDLSQYIQQIAEEMAMVNAINIENPILVSIIISQQIQAKEKGINIVVQSTTPMNDLTMNPVKLAQIFKIILDTLVQNELYSLNESRMISVYVNEDDDNYYFDFKNSEEAALVFKNELKKKTLKPATETEGVSRLKIVETLLKELNGELTHTSYGPHTVQWKFTIKKNGKKRLQANRFDINASLR